MSFNHLGIVWSRLAASAILMIACGVGAQTVCPFGQSACGKRCYNASKGETCTNGTICPFGKSACGNRCYDRSKGETCTNSSGKSK
jgi:hypothetical protein